MKVRIIKCSQYRSVWYKIQYKSFLFWHTLKDVYDCDFTYFSEEEAREKCEALLSKPKHTIIATFED